MSRFGITKKPITKGKFILYGPPTQVFNVRGNLWIGSVPPIGCTVGEYFDCLVLCAREYQPIGCFYDVQITSALLDDDFSTPIIQQECTEAVRAAKQVVKWINDGLRVLVTCMAGYNRSGLVCALVLMYGQEQMSADQAIQTIRAARGDGALCNNQFVKFIELLHSYRTPTPAILP